MKKLFILALFALLQILNCSKEQECVPDTTTYNLNGANIKLARELGDKWISQKPPETLAWNWEPAVLMFAITKLYKYTGEIKYFEYYKNWIDYYIERGYYLMMSDQVIPSAIAGDLYKRTCDEKYRLVIDDVYVYLTEEAPRTPEGGISHLGTIAPSLPQLWIDSLFMFGIPMINAYNSTGDKKYIDLLAEQLIIFSQLLQDKDAGLFRHAWIDGRAVPEEPVFWARGNGWVLVTITEMLSVPGDFKRKEEVRAIYDLLLKAIITTQDSGSGLWWTVLNRPGETYLETSASALFTYSLALGINEGIIDSQLYSDILVKGVNGIKSKIAYENGYPVVTDISKGTQPGNFEDYKNVPLGSDIPYGIGAIILALIESER